MRKIFCDKCGKEITRGAWAHYNPDGEVFDICTDCHTKFRFGLKSDDDGKESNREN